MNEKIQITITVDQAIAMNEALDVYTRLCLGQLEVIREVVANGTIPIRTPDSAERGMATAHQLDDVETHLRAIKGVLDFPWSGSLGIGHPHVLTDGKRAYEIHKVLAKLLAEYRNPDPKFRGVDYDGLSVRYTQDPAPEAFMTGIHGKRETPIRVLIQGSVEIAGGGVGYMVQGDAQAVCFFIDPVGRAWVSASTTSDDDCPVVYLSNDGEMDTEIEFPEFKGWRFHAGGEGKSIAIALVRD